MKKFLTVLLVIAVMFTFSFGSAFAAVGATTAPDDTESGDVVLTEAEVLAAIDKAAKLAQDDVDDSLATALSVIFAAGKDSKEISGIEVKKATVEAAFKEYVYDVAIAKVAANKNTKLDAIEQAIKDVKDKAASDSTAKTYNGKFYDATTVTNEEAQSKWLKAGYAKYVSGVYEDVDTYKVGVACADTDYAAVFAEDSLAAGKALEIAEKSVKAFKAETIAAVEAISLDGYSKEYKNNEKSNYVLASEVKAAALKALDEVEVTGTQWSDFAGKVTAIETIYKAPVNQGNPGGWLYTGKTGIKGLDQIQKVADEPTEEAKLAFAKSLVIGDITGQISTDIDAELATLSNQLLDLKLDKDAKASDIAAKEEAIAVLKDAKAYAIEIVTYLVNDIKDYNDLIVDKTNAKYSDGTKFVAADAKTVAANWAYSDSTNTLTAYNGTTTKTYKLAKTASDDVFDVMTKIEDLKEAAELAKLSVNLDGSKVVEIEAALEDAIDAAYKADWANAVLKVNTIVSNLYDRQEELIYGDTIVEALNARATNGLVKIGDRKYPVVESWDDAIYTDYDEDYYDALRAVVKETKDAVRATATVAEADAAFLAGFEKFEAVPTKADKQEYQMTKAYRDAKDDYTAKIKAHAASRIKYLQETETDKNYDLGSNNANWDAMVANVIADLADAYNASELEKAYNDAIATIDGLKTKAELEAAKTDLLKRVNALPSSATIADKAVVDALRADVDDFNDYVETVIAQANWTTYKVSLVTKLENAEAAIVKSEVGALQDAYDAIMKDNKVTADEIQAVKELRKAYDAFVESYLPENYDNADERTVAGFFTTYAKAPMTTPETAISNLEADVTKLQVKAFNEAVAKLDVNNVDPVAVKAARAAYEELSRVAKYDDPHHVYQGAAYDKLVALEKVLAVDVQALKITASSKATKGAITVTWTVKGNKAAADGYQVWKSTKKNSGFKKAFTTSKTTYKNTKGLKKGVKYYYKVRAYKVVDGKNVYSDWSNKAYRTAK